MEERLEDAPIGSTVAVLTSEDVPLGSAVLVVDSLQDVEEALRGAAVLVEKVVGWGGEEALMRSAVALDVLAAVVGKEGVGMGLEVRESEAVGSNG